MHWRPPQKTPLQAPTQAATLHRWLHEVAEHYNTPLVVMARQLRTTQHLAVEVARLLNTTARLEARTLVQDRKRIPDPSDLWSRLVYCHAQPFLEQQKKVDRERANAAFTSELRQQAKLERQQRQQAKQQAMQKGKGHDHPVSSGAEQADRHRTEGDEDRRD
jgi:hypothetical protein